MTLKPCPFCGGEACHAHGEGRHPMRWVSCSACYARTDEYEDDQVAAAEAWNARAQPQPKRSAGYWLQQQGDIWFLCSGEFDNPVKHQLCDFDKFDAEPLSAALEASQPSRGAVEVAQVWVPIEDVELGARVIAPNNKGLGHLAGVVKMNPYGTGERVVSDGQAFVTPKVVSVASTVRPNDEILSLAEKCARDYPHEAWDYSHTVRETPREYVVDACNQIAAAIKHLSLTPATVTQAGGREAQKVNFRPTANPRLVLSEGNISIHFNQGGEWVSVLTYDEQKKLWQLWECNDSGTNLHAESTSPAELVDAANKLT